MIEPKITAIVETTKTFSLSVNLDVSKLSDVEVLSYFAASKILLKHVEDKNEALKAEILSRKLKSADVLEVGRKVDITDAYESSYDIPAIGMAFYKADRLKDFWPLVTLVKKRVDDTLKPDDELVKVIEANKSTRRKAIQEVACRDFSKDDRKRLGIAG